MSLNRCVYAFFGAARLAHLGPARSSGGVGRVAWHSHRYLLPILMVGVSILGWIAAAGLAAHALRDMNPVLLLATQLAVSAGLASAHPHGPAAPTIGLGTTGYVLLLGLAGLVELTLSAPLRSALPELLVLAGLGALLLHRRMEGPILLRAVAAFAGIALVAGFGIGASGTGLVIAGMLTSTAWPLLARTGSAVERLLLAVFLLLLLPLSLSAGGAGVASIPVSAWVSAAGSGLMLYATVFARGLSSGAAGSFVRFAPISGIVLAVPIAGGWLSLRRWPAPRLRSQR